VLHFSCHFDAFLVDKTQAGNWIDCPSGYLTVNFYIDSVQDKTIFGSAQWYGNQDYINLTKK